MQHRLRTVPTTVAIFQIEKIKLKMLPNLHPARLRDAITKQLKAHMQSIQKCPQHIAGFFQKESVSYAS